MAFELWKPKLAPRIAGTSMALEDKLLISDHNFEERDEDGINSIREIWKLSWPAIPDSDADEIEAFFDAKGFTETFLYRVPGRADTLQWNFTAFDRAAASGTMDGITISIRQNFDIEDVERGMQQIVTSLTKNGTNADLEITDPQTVICTEVTDLAGIRRATVQHVFAPQVGGTPTSVTAYLQTNLEGPWIDIARHKFTTAASVLLFTIVGEQPVDPAIVPTDGTLDDGAGGDEIIQGILGQKLRLKVVVVGTYPAGSSLASRVHCA